MAFKAGRPVLERVPDWRSLAERGSRGDRPPRWLRRLGLAAALVAVVALVLILGYRGQVSSRKRWRERSSPSGTSERVHHVVRYRRT